MVELDFGLSSLPNEATFHMPLTVGVLIIGSLYWRCGGRERWRKWRLTNDEWFVRVPIQYCRRSRNGTYTMVFSELPVDQFGQARIVQCRSEVRSVSDLITEAEWLWSAEESTDEKDVVPRFRVCQPEHHISPKKGRGWGCVALLNNPNRKMPEGLLDEWTKRVAIEAHYNANPLRRVDNKGMLQIPWPTLTSDSKPLPDLLLATSNDREPTCPTVREIADAWNQHPEVDYFSNNRKYGIETFQDQAIQGLLHEHL
jgi:hypothetical protein